MLPELGRSPDVLRIAEAKNGDEDRAQEQQSEGKTGALTEGLRDTNHDHSRDHDVDDGNEEQQEPPEWLAGDLEQNNRFIDRNDRCPAGLSGLGKDLPHPGDNQDTNYESDD